MSVPDLLQRGKQSAGGGEGVTFYFQALPTGLLERYCCNLRHQFFYVVHLGWAIEKINWKIQILNGIEIEIANMPKNAPGSKVYERLHDSCVLFRCTFNTYGKFYFHLSQPRVHCVLITILVLSP